MKRSKDEPITLKQLLLEHDVKLIDAPAKTLSSWIESKVSEYSSVKSSKDEQIIEGYSNLNTRILNKIIKWLRSLENEIEVILATKKAQRKKRSVSSKPKVVNTSDFKYKVSDKDYSVESLSPDRIIGSKGVILFNTRYRKVQVLLAPDGGELSVKGQTMITGYDEALSLSKSIRKPMDAFPIFLNRTKLQIQKYLRTEIKTKEVTPNGRSNADTIILRVF